MSIGLSKRAQKLKPSPTLTVSSKAQELKKKGIPIISFGAGEPDFRTPANICNKAIEAINNGFHHYTPAPGTVELRKAVCEKLKTDNGLIYEPDNIVVSCGAKHSLFNLFLVLLNDGDEVLVPSPYWVSYPEQIEIAGGKMVGIPSSMETGFQINPDKLEELTTPCTRGIVLNSPCNPSGAVYSRDSLESIAAWAKKHDAFIISDEIYEKLIYDGGTHISIASFGKETFERTIVVNGVSKSHAMTGWRIGYAAGPRHIMKKASALQSQNTSNPASISQAAALEALVGDQSSVLMMREAFNKRRNLMVNLLNDISGIRAVKPGGAFYVFPDVSSFYGKKVAGVLINDSITFCSAALLVAEVALVPGVAFGMDNHVRLSYAMSDDDIKTGLKRLKDFLKG